MGQNWFFAFLVSFFFMYVGILPACVSVCHGLAVSEEAKGSLDLLVLKLQKVVSHWVCAGKNSQCS